jgi:beta-N-acetylhexosaminidase
MTISRLLLLIGAATVAGCAPSRTETPAGAPRSTVSPAATPVANPGSHAAVRAPSSPARPTPWADSVLATLSLREKVAQMVWPTILGDYGHTESPRWQRVVSEIRNEKVGGYTVSVGSPLEIATKVNAMQQMAEVPLLFGADMEFGAGYRARGGHFLPNAIELGGAVVFPPQMAVGATGDTLLAYEQGRITAIESRALGVHIAYAPILDVNNNPANPVISTRSYAENPQLAARLGRSFIRGLQEHGMVATGKHFPGHGDTDVNSHLALPVVSASRARIDSVELVPFRAAVDAGLGAIMSFHGAMPALDPSETPATLSPGILTGLLRGEMGFRGLIISDAMDMRGVLDRYGAAEATKLAVAAGADVLIQPLSITETIDAVVAGVREGRYTEARVDESARRILRMKEEMGIHRNRMVDVDHARTVVGHPSHVAMARTIGERSITLLRDRSALLPLSQHPRDSRVLSITLARRTDLMAGTAFNAELIAHFPALRTATVNADDQYPDYARLLTAADSATIVIVSSYVAHSWDAATADAPGGFADFVRQLTARGRKPIVVAMGNPYLLLQIPEVPTYLIGWGGFSVSQQAAARALLGQIAISGRMPISIPSQAVLGSGEARGVAPRR